MAEQPTGEGLAKSEVGETEQTAEERRLERRNSKEIAS